MKKIQESLIGGFFATLALLLVSYIENTSGTFTYITPVFLSTAADSSLLMAFIFQLLAGWAFALIYSYVFVKVFSWAKNDWFRGMVYGIMLAILIEISLYITVEDVIMSNLLLDTLGMIIAYAIFGMVLGAFIPLKRKKKTQTRHHQN